MYTEHQGFKTPDAPLDWPFGRLTPEQMQQRDREIDVAEDLHEAGLVAREYIEELMQ